jgi:hypothetical protein
VGSLLIGKSCGGECAADSAAVCVGVGRVLSGEERVIAIVFSGVAVSYVVARGTLGGMLLAGEWTRVPVLAFATRTGMFCADAWVR